VVNNVTRARDKKRLIPFVLKDWIMIVMLGINNAVDAVKMHCTVCDKN